MKKKIFIALAFCLFLGTSKVSAATVKSYFPDENFFNCIVSKETSLTAETDEADFNFEQADYSLNCENKNITSVEGIEKFTNLTSINLSNNNISEIDLTNNTELKNLYLNNNKLTDIDLTKNTKLEILDIRNNKLSEIDLSKNTNLGTLYIVGNPILKNINITVGEEFPYKEKVKMPNDDPFQVIFAFNEENVSFNSITGKLTGTKVGTEQATLTIKNTKKELSGEYVDTEFPITITVTDPNATPVPIREHYTPAPTAAPTDTETTEEKKTSETTTNPKTGVYGGSIILVAVAAGAYILMKNKNKYNSVR